MHCKKIQFKISLKSSVFKAPELDQWQKEQIFTAGILQCVKVLASQGNRIILHKTEQLKTLN